jgi:rhodanese-related sulfurtransferase
LGIRIAPEELAARVAAGTAPCTIDVRSKAEFEEGHVPGALHIPFWQMAARWREVPVAPDVDVVVYCGHGPRAYMAGTILKRHGFTGVRYLMGHMKKWRELYLPVEGK